ncbi:MAG TPA: haloacid dehalogenase [Dehalococcoidia bacterium]|nr:haloacid dehalogenase [Dehalococcoidia bacterium]
MRRALSRIEAISEAARQTLAAKNQAREAALTLCRDALRNSANGIRAVHRGDFEAARALIDSAGALLAGARTALANDPDIFYAGFVHDAQKEYAEARVTYAVIAGQDVPLPEEIGVEVPAYLNGMAEAVGELRRHLLDALRSGDIERCEETLDVMEEIYGNLVTFDYPDAMTGGLRRTTDNVRGILERTRGDLAVAVRQRELERKLAEFERRMDSR